MQQHHTMTHKTTQCPQDPTPQQMGDLRTNLQPVICGPNQPQPEDMLSRAYEIHQKQQSTAYLQHILRNQHEYGTVNNLMTLLKPLNNPNMLTPYKQFYIQTLHREGKLIPEQCPGNPNPLFELAIHPTHAPHDRVNHTISLILDAYIGYVQ